ncbi:MAG: sulfatase-like hydrolase/transferase, partial [Pseudomonadota bacterium]
MTVKNVLFVFSDQHAKRVVGCYGDRVVSTPHMDRLAAEGLAFDAAYCPSPICVPSRMAMLTARWPYRQACWTNDDVLPSGLPTWLHAMGAAGYKPALIGRLHAIGP